jgi:hypothetical protein
MAADTFKTAEGTFLARIIPRTTINTAPGSNNLAEDSLAAISEM